MSDDGPERVPLREAPPAETLRTRLWRHGYNLFPAYRGTGARIDRIGGDWQYVRVRIPFNWRTRNLVGAIFGGSLYGAVDPVYMSLLRRNLDTDRYTVWDKAADIRFRKPGRETLYAEFEVDDEELDRIREALSPGESVDRVYDVAIVDAEGVVHAECEKTVYVREDE